jgi:hypothetical protein
MTSRSAFVAALLFLSSLGSSCPAAESGQQAIFNAIKSGDVAAVRRILDSDPAQAAAHDQRGISVVLHALLARRNKEFIDPQHNELLAAVLAGKPTLDFFETCAVGSADAAERMLATDSALLESWHSIAWTPLHFAAFAGNGPVLDLLLKKRAFVDARARNVFRNTPLAVALLTGQIEAARRLIAAGADVNVRQAGGLAPIHEAALLGRNDILTLLLDSGAEIGARGNDGRTALTEAERGKHAETAAFLRSRGGKNATITADLAREPKT